jgi:hypothetical protein
MPSVPVFINNWVAWIAAITAVSVSLWQIIKLVITITKFTQTVDELTISVQELTKSSSSDHDKMFRKLKTHDNMLHDHGLRLRDIEHDVEDIKNKGDN